MLTHNANPDMIRYDESYKRPMTPYNMRCLMREADLTHEEVADLLGVSRSTVHKMVHGDVEIRNAYAFTLRHYVEHGDATTRANT